MILLFSLLIASAVFQGRQGQLYLFIFFIIIFLYAGLRGDVGQDTLSYVRMYNEYGGVPVTNWFFVMEPLFVLLVWLHKLLFDNVTNFFLLFSAFQVFLLSVASKGLHHRNLFLFLYAIIFFFEFNLNILRAGSAFLIFLCSLSLSNKSDKASFFIFLVASLFHLSVLAFFPILISRINRPFKYIVGYFFSIVIFGIIFFPIIHHKFLFYISSMDLSLKWSTILFILTSIFIFTLILKRKINSILLNASLILIFTIFLIPYIGIAYRLLQGALIVIFYLLCERKLINVRELKADPNILFITALAIWFALFNWSFYLGEQEMRIRTGKGDPSYSFIPYSTFLKSNNR